MCFREAKIDDARFVIAFTLFVFSDFRSVSPEVMEGVCIGKCIPKGDGLRTGQDESC